MSCPHCTRRIDEDGVPSEYCTGFYHTDEHDGSHVRIDLRIEPFVDEDDGKRYWVVCIGSYDTKMSKVLGVEAASMEAPPYCPWCGERL